MAAGYGWFPRVRGSIGLIYPIGRSRRNKEEPSPNERQQLDRRKMTAEVVVMNKSGVALAADSKVTITSGYGEKTYDTVNKVFTLSKVHPVGIMIFGSAEFMLYPWETIIKQYRAEKRNKSFATVDAWSDDFLKYVKGFGEIRKVDISTNVHNILSSWLAELTTISLNTARDKNISIPSSNLTSTLLSIIKRHSGYISKSVDLLTPTATKLVMNAHKAEIDESSEDAFRLFRRRQRPD